MIRALNHAGEASAALNSNKGYCLVLNADEGQLVYALSQQCDLRIIGLESSPRKVESARENLMRAGVYGSRVTIHQGTADAELPYGSMLANLIVSDEALRSGRLPASAAEVLRMLRPEGGLAYIGQSKAAEKLGERLTGRAAKAWLGTHDGEWQLRKRDGLWMTGRCDRLPGGGEWTQLYADAGHTANSEDELEGPTTVPRA